jgi:quinolinate synthase
VNPDKKVLIPDMASGCPMADMVTAEKVRELKKQYPKAAVVCYINSTAEVKAESDICCTSGNAQKVIESLKGYKQVIFVPDKYLGHFLSLASDKEFILINGYCPTHARISPKVLDILKAKYKNAPVLVHPECHPNVKEKADKILSTGKMCSFVKNSASQDFIIGTEREIVHRMQKENPGKNFIHVGPLAVCPNMKKNNLEKIADVLDGLTNVVKVEENVRLRAKKCIERMLEIS